MRCKYFFFIESNLPNLYPFPSQEFGSFRNHWQKGLDHIFATNLVARYL